LVAVYLGLGSNIDPDNNLRIAVDELRRRFGELIVSPVYRSAPVGFDGPDFLNLVVAVETDAGPLDILEQIERIHEMAGRSRGPDKFSSRPLDIDLLLYGDSVEPEPPLRLPRPDVLEYGFVLRPLADIAPDLVHPVTGKAIGEHWREFDGERHPLTAANLTPENPG
jgi:2-amino-4-hydroxy-6-hydroxymethyldihydropteridine diphosphokinase